MAYFADEAEMYRGAAALVDKVLRGAKPAELPVEQPQGLSWQSIVRPPRLWAYKFRTSYLRLPTR